jgi:N4-gp56 family major capsid protein
MANITTTSQVDPGVAIFYDRVLLRRAVPFLIHEKAAQTRNISRKSGNTIKFRRFASLALATTPLVEGTTPTGSQLSKTDIQAVVKQYGDYVHITDWVDLTVEDSVLTEAAEVLGEQMGQTRDVLVRDILAAGGTTIDCNSVALTDAKIKAAIRTLVNNNAKYVTRLVKAGTGQGTVPVSPAYWAFSHAELLDDWQSITDWVPVRKYARPEEADEAEWGSYEQIRVLLSSQGYKSGALYKVPIVGKDAYAVTEIEGGAAKNIVKPFGSGGTTDPLNQRATSGWKMTFAARILNDAFMAVLINIAHSS